MLFQQMSKDVYNMERIETWKEKIRDKLPLLILIFCIIQPFLDIAGYWQARLGIGNGLTMALRMLLLAGSVLLGFILSDRKRVYVYTAMVLACLTGLHVFACLQNDNGYQEPVTDLVNLIRIYFLPMMTICFITFLRQNEKSFSAMKKGMVIDILLIAAVQLISAVTGTDPHTYAVDKTGILGWFLWTNSQSAILGMLAPIAICWVMNRWRDRLLPVALITAISEATLYVLAPRLSYGSLIIVGLGTALCLLIADRKRWKQALVIVLVTCLFVGAYPLSPTYKRLNKNSIRAEKTKQQIRELDITPIETEVPTDTDGEPVKDAKPRVIIDKKTADKYEKLYRSQDTLWSMVDRFGRDKVLEAYGYTLDPTILSNTRTIKIKFCELLMDESGTLSRLFGLNLIEMRYQRYDKDSKLVTDNYDVENDFHGIYFLTGWVGLALMIIFLLWFGLRALWAVIKKPKLCFTPTMAAFALAYGIGLLHAYFTASVLRRNNASVYLAMVLAGLWYLSQRQKQAKESK